MSECNATQSISSCSSITDSSSHFSQELTNIMTDRGKSPLPVVVMLLLLLLLLLQSEICMQNQNELR